MRRSMCIGFLSGSAESSVEVTSDLHSLLDRHRKMTALRPNLVFVPVRWHPTTALRAGEQYRAMGDRIDLLAVRGVDQRRHVRIRPPVRGGPPSRRAGTDPVATTLAATRAQQMVLVYASAENP